MGMAYVRGREVLVKGEMSAPLNDCSLTPLPKSTMIIYLSEQMKNATHGSLKERGLNFKAIHIYPSHKKFRFINT